MSNTSDPQPELATTQAPVSLRAAIGFWLKLGFISFGGPAGQIAIMHEELVEKRRWISERRFLHALNYCMMLPGPEAQQLATYLGWLMHRTRGGIIAGGLFILPSLLLLILLSWLYVAFGQVPAVAALLYGIKPAVTAIVAQAAWRIGAKTLKNRWLWAIAGGAFVAIFWLQLPFPLIIALAALTGVIGGKWQPHYFAVSPAHQAEHASAPRALIDDQTARPEHTRFRWSRLLLILGGAGLLWASPMLILTLTCGWEHTWTQMSWFFTKAALLTFGGAYAVLPYVYQGAVVHFGWLSAPQMIDGLALGETTPGPLIMVVAFVGFVGGYLDLASAGGNAFLHGAIAATLVTWFTFLPSFVFILAGGPLVESTRDQLHFTAPLTAITAAVVGVILNLALFFAWHVFWPQGIGEAGVVGSPDVIAVLISAGAAIALFRYKINVIKVIGASALAGLLLQGLQGLPALF